MWSRITYCLLYILSYVFVESVADIPPFVKRCKPDDNQCMVSVCQATTLYFADAVNIYGNQSYDPLYIDYVQLEHDDVKITLRNSIHDGLRNCKFLDTDRDIEKGTVRFDVECPFNLKGQYFEKRIVDASNAKAKYLYGDGDFIVTADKIKISILIDLMYVKIDGITHFQSVGYDFTYEFMEKVHVDLENLFNGDVARAKLMIDNINKNWKEFFSTLKFGDRVASKLVDSIVKTWDKFFAIVPSDELEIA